MDEQGKETYQWITIALEPGMLSWNPQYHNWMSVCAGSVREFAKWATDAYNEQIKEALEVLQKQNGVNSISTILAHIHSEGKGNLFRYLSEKTHVLPDKVREGNVYRIPIITEELSPMFMNVAASFNGEEIVSFVFRSLDRKAIVAIREGIKKYIGV